MTEPEVAHLVDQLIPCGKWAYKERTLDIRNAERLKLFLFDNLAREPCCYFHPKSNFVILISKVLRI